MEMSSGASVVKWSEEWKTGVASAMRKSSANLTIFSYRRNRPEPLSFELHW